MDDLIVKFCEDRRSWLVVIVGTLGLCLVLVLPSVDDYVAICKEKNEVTEQLALAYESARRLADYEERHAEQVDVVAERLDRTLNENNEADYRNAIVKMVRDNGCQLRRLNISSPTARDWGQNDNPLEKQFDKGLNTTGFQLERRQVTLSLAGPSTSVRRLIERFEQHDKQVHVQGLELKPAAGDGRHVELSMDLEYYTLRRRAA